MKVLNTLLLLLLLFLFSLFIFPFSSLFLFFPSFCYQLLVFSYFFLILTLSSFLSLPTLHYFMFLLSPVVLPPPLHLIRSLISPHHLLHLILFTFLISRFPNSSSLCLYAFSSLHFTFFISLILFISCIFPLPPPLPSSYTSFLYPFPYFLPFSPKSLSFSRPSSSISHIFLFSLAFPLVISPTSLPILLSTVPPFFFISYFYLTSLSLIFLHSTFPLRSSLFLFHFLSFLASNSPSPPPRLGNRMHAESRISVKPFRGRDNTLWRSDAALEGENNLYKYKCH